MPTPKPPDLSKTVSYTWLFLIKYLFFLIHGYRLLVKYTIDLVQQVDMCSRYVMINPISILVLRKSHALVLWHDVH